MNATLRQQLEASLDTGTAEQAYQTWKRYQDRAITIAQSKPFLCDFDRTSGVMLAVDHGGATLSWPVCGNSHGGVHWESCTFGDWLLDCTADELWKWQQAQKPKAAE